MQNQNSPTEALYIIAYKFYNIIKNWSGLVVKAIALQWYGSRFDTHEVMLLFFH